MKIIQIEVYQFSTFKLIDGNIILMHKIDCQNMENHLYSNPGNLYPDSKIIISYQEDWQKELYIKRIVQFKNSPIGFKKIVFLGNSLIEGGGDWNKRFGVDNILL